MIQLYSLMWILAIFFGIIGAMRGWNREIIALAGILLGMFALFQFDALLRGVILLGFSRGQAFAVQLGIFLVIVFFSYQNRAFVQARRIQLNSQDSLLGAFVGLVNGYVIGGAIWYFIDINEYPFAPYIMTPAANSPSVQRINQVPLVFLSGGIYGSGEFLVIGVIVLFLVVLIVL